MILNKIVLDNNIINISSNEDYYLEINKNIDVIININKNVMARIIIISLNCSYRLIYNLYENANVTINSLNNNTVSDISINLINNNASIKYNHSILSSNNSINNFNINHLFNNTNSIININGINLNNNVLKFNINGIINKKLSNINCIEKSKIINFKNGNSTIIPNLIIDSNNVNVSHSAYIGCLDKKERFYMASRGLTDSDIDKLLYKSILLGNMDLRDEKNKFIEIINEWW